jgi:hypothetical protein
LVDALSVLPVVAVASDGAVFFQPQAVKTNTANAIQMNFILYMFFLL